MARKVARVTISSEGRDQGKQFVLTEMPARQAEKWAGRALLAFVGSGLDIPEDVLNQGMAAMATFGFKAFTALKFEAAEPLMDEMFRCIEICPDPSKPGVVRSLIDDDIEEMSTILRLRMEVFQLHVDFSIAAALSGLVEKAKAAANSRTTSTSPAPSAL